MGYEYFDCPDCGEENELLITPATWKQPRPLDEDDRKTTDCEFCDTTIEYVYYPESGKLHFDPA